MLTLPLTRWLLQATLRSPIFWIGALGSAALGALLPHLAPAAGDATWERLVTWSFPLGLGAASVSLAVLASHCTFLAWAAPAVRWRAKGLALVGAASIWQAALALGLWTFEPLFPPLAESARATAGILLQDLHLAAVGLLVLRLGLNPATAALLFLITLWVGPTLATDGEGRALFFSPLLDASTHPEHLSSFATAPVMAFSGVAAVASLVLSSWLLRRPSAGTSPSGLAA